MKYLLWIMLLLFVVDAPCNASGILDWCYYTQQGNKIQANHYNRIELSLKNQPKNYLTDLKSWYFYRNSVIGSYNNPLQYFVVHEEEGTILTFKTKAEWTQYLTDMGLVPYRTIWHQTHKGDGNNEFMVTFYFVAIFLVYLILYFPVLLAAYRVKFNLQKPITIGCAILTGIAMTGLFYYFREMAVYSY